MDNKLKEDLLKRLKHLEDSATQIKASASFDLYENADIPSGPFYGFRSAGLSLLKETFGINNTYYIEFEIHTQIASYYELLNAIEILKSLHDEIENNWLWSVRGLISAEILSDFSEMASHFIELGYKDAAAVILGSLLEEQLRQMAIKNEIDITIEKDGNSISKKADRLNSDICNAGIYNSLVQKSVTANLDLRNKAAHGKYSEYDIQQVRLMYSAVLDFINRYSV
jgi:hypothetical protein